MGEGEGGRNSWPAATSWCSLRLGFTVCVKSPGEILTQEMWYEEKNQKNPVQWVFHIGIHCLAQHGGAISYRVLLVFPPNAVGKFLTASFLAQPGTVSITTAGVKARFIAQTQQQQRAAGGK